MTTTNISLIDIVNERLNSEKLELPVLPNLAIELQSMLTSDGADIEHISAKIAADQVLASQLLRVANSAFYSGLNKVSRIRDSVMRVGTRQVSSLVFMITQQEQYKSTDKSLRPYFELLWKHATSCALGSKWLADRLGYASLAEEAFMAGLFHDIGKLVLLKVIEQINSSGKDAMELSHPVLFEVLDQMHTTQGAALLKRWNLPEIYCEVVEKHHQEDFDSGNAVLTTVRFVDLACRKLGIGLQNEPAILLAATPEGEALGISDLLAAELEITLEDAVTCS